MEFKIRKANDCEFEQTIDINSLEELKQIKEKFKTKDDRDYWKYNELIINFDYNVILYNYCVE